MKYITEDEVIDVLKNQALRTRQYQDDARYVFASIRFMTTEQANDYFVDVDVGVDYSKFGGGFGGSGITDLATKLEQIRAERRRQITDTFKAYQNAHDGMATLNTVMTAYISLPAEEKEVLSKLYIEGLSRKQALLTLSVERGLSRRTAYRLRSAAIEKILKKCNPAAIGGDEEPDKPSE